jgi:hypothetical protein
MATRRQARRAVEHYADALSSFPNVVGVGVQPVEAAAHDAIGRDAAGRGAAGQDATDEYAVAVYVERKVALDELEIQERLPVVLEITGQDDVVRVPVTVVESGRFDPEEQHEREADP